ncbi:MAG TPA: 2-oxoacid:acceptor oxidoreductase subunit alpha, partial [Thermoprotei archaeon]|nr:2-oxoacid:acceptor oxidoreductase subunit alpha [Thermoprotei archaeon]
IAIGSVARSTLALVRDLRESGLKVGLFRPISIWPFDEDRFIKMARRVKKIIVAEMNQGQLVWIIKKILWDNKLFNVDVYSLPLLLPDLPSPDEIYDEIKSRGWKI